MKLKITLALIFLILLQSALALECQKGYYDGSDPSGKCLRCPLYYTECTSANSGTMNTRVVGFTNVAGGPSAYCVTTGGANTYYKKDTNTCQPLCKTGCATCQFDYDFCHDCQGGFTWNNDFTCIPAVIGLEAASLALLVIAFIFSLIGCCTVIKAKKN